MAYDEVRFFQKTTYIIVYIIVYNYIIVFYVVLSIQTRNRVDIQTISGRFEFRLDLEQLS